MSVPPVISALARMRNDEPTLRTDGRAVGSDRVITARTAGRSRWSWRGQSAVRQLSGLGGANRRAMARFAGAVRSVELGVSAVQSLGQSRRVGNGLPHTAG